MKRPRIKRTVEPIETLGGNITFMRPSVRSDVEISQLDDNDRRLLSAIDGTRTLAQLHDEFGQLAVDTGLEQLGQFGLLEDGADDDRIEPDELARFDRQMRYFSDVRNPDEATPSEYQTRLRESRVAILGVGGLGSWAAWALACCGIGNLDLIDGDRVEVSNLNRQILYAEDDVGLPKVEVAVRRLQAFNSSSRITGAFQQLTGPDEIASFIDGVDVVVDTADIPAHDFDRWCNEACFRVGVPYITMSHFPPIARVGPLFVPGVTGCHACQEIGWRRNYPDYDHVVEQRRAKPRPAATLGPPCGMIGAQVGMEVMHLLTGIAEPSTLGVAHITDLMTMQVDREEVVPESGCPVCGSLERAPMSA